MAQECMERSRSFYEFLHGCESQNKHSRLNTREFTCLVHDLCNLNNLNNETNTLREAGASE